MAPARPTRKMKQYLILYEKTKGGYGAYSPDVPGCVAVGKTKAIVKRRMKEALAFHFEGLREDGLRIPRATTTADYVEVEE